MSNVFAYMFWVFNKIMGSVISAVLPTRHNLIDVRIPVIILNYPEIDVNEDTIQQFKAMNAINEGEWS